MDNAAVLNGHSGPNVPRPRQLGRKRRKSPRGPTTTTTTGSMTRLHLCAEHPNNEPARNRLMKSVAHRVSSIRRVLRHLSARFRRLGQSASRRTSPHGSAHVPARPCRIRSPWSRSPAPSRAQVSHTSQGSQYGLGIHHSNHQTKGARHQDASPLVDDHIIY